MLSTLQYAATKEDADAIFACEATHTLINQETELEPFPIHCEWKAVLTSVCITVLQLYEICFFHLLI